MYTNRKFVKVIIFIFIFIICFTFSNTYADDIELNTDIFNIQNEIELNNTIQTSSKETKLNVNSRACIVLDRLSNKILYGKNEYNKVKMASTTKIMTATVIIENCNLKETVEVYYMVLCFAQVMMLL